MSSKLIAALVFAITIVMISALDIYIPATPYLSDVFSVTDYTMKMTFLMGPLAGLVVSIPIGNYSDFYGRRRILIFCMILFLIGAFLCTLASTIESFFLGRLILSIGSAGLNVLCGVILSDLFKGVQLAKYLGIYSSIFPVVFALAPMIGAQILTHLGWRYIFFTLIISMGLLLPFVIKFLPETRSDKIGETPQEITSLLSRLMGLITK
ncbi:MAG TPA: MFS transporter, partial [Candidatus Nitrosotenuis sp.]|nr:MFS transporter [Candidatus Nitrosotenuis sp.]